VNRFLSQKTMRHLRQVGAAPALGNERYELLDEIGRGGMGIVYRARDRSLDRDVALKILRSEYARPDMLERMRREAHVLAMLEHPGVVPIHDLGISADGLVYYTMKLVDGVSLEKHFAKQTDLRERLRTFERLCEAVSFAHARGVLHRDLKPGNVMVGSFGEVLVLDWGVAKRVSDPELERIDEAADTVITQHGTVLGTPGYMSPEQAAAQSVDERSDVYSLGAMLTEILAGSNPPAPKRLQAVAAKAAAREIDRRYASVDAMRSDIRAFLDSRPIAAYDEPWYEGALRFAERNRGILLLFGAYLLMRLLVAVFAGV